MAPKSNGWSPKRKKKSCGKSHGTIKLRKQIANKVYYDKKKRNNKKEIIHFNQNLRNQNEQLKDEVHNLRSQLSSIKNHNEMREMNTQNIDYCIQKSNSKQFMKFSLPKL